MTSTTLYCTRCGGRVDALERCPDCGAANRYRDCPPPDAVRRERGATGSAERAPPPRADVRAAPLEPPEVTEDIREEIAGVPDTTELLEGEQGVDRTEEMTEAHGRPGASREAEEPIDGGEDAPTVKRPHAG